MRIAKGDWSLNAQVLRSLMTAAIVVAASVVGSGRLAAESAKRPNIVFILADDKAASEPPTTQFACKITYFVAHSRPYEIGCNCVRLPVIPWN